MTLSSLKLPRRGNPGNKWAAGRPKLPYRARCAVRGCAGAQRKGFPVCAGHWAQVPDDLQLRLKLARDEEDTEWNAAVAAVIESVEDLPGSAVDTDDND